MKKSSLIKKVHDKRSIDNGSIEYLVEWKSSEIPKWLNLKMLFFFF